MDLKEDSPNENCACTKEEKADRQRALLQMRNCDLFRMAPQMRIYEEIIPITEALQALADEYVQQLRRNIPVTINLNELDPRSRAYVEYVAEQELAAQKRVRKNGEWCWFCGCDGRLVGCNCLFPESLRCAEHKICKDCSAAHLKIANHMSNLLKYPRSNRVSSRRYQGWKQLREAAETIEEKLVAEGRLDLADTLEVALIPDEYDAWECSTSELRRVVLGSFRKARFVRFQELARELDNKIQEAMMESAVRLLGFLK
jgi:hypothetical protein